MPDEVLICEDGDVVQLGDDGIDFAGEVSAAHVFVDGIVGDVGIGVLRDRRVLAEEGVVVAVVTIDGRTGELVGSPEIVSRGFLDEPGAEPVVEELRSALDEGDRGRRRRGRSRPRCPPPGDPAHRRADRERPHAAPADDRAASFSRPEQEFAHYRAPGVTVASSGWC